MECAYPQRKTPLSPHSVADLGALRHEVEKIQATLSARNDTMHSMEQQVLAIRRRQEEEDCKYPSLADFDALLRKSFQPLEQQLKELACSQQTGTEGLERQVTEQIDALRQHIDIAQTLEDSIKNLMAMREAEPKDGKLICEIPDGRATSRERTFQDDLTNQVVAQLSEKLPEKFGDQLIQILNEKFTQLSPRESSSLTDISTEPTAKLVRAQQTIPQPLGGLEANVGSQQAVPLAFLEVDLDSPRTRLSISRKERPAAATMEAPIRQSKLNSTSPNATSPVETAESLPEPKMINITDPGADTLKKKNKLAMNEDVAIDTSCLAIRDNGSLGAVFSTDNDPSSECYNVEEYYYRTGMCQAVARDSRFANFTVFVVMVNAIFLGVDSDWNYADNLYKSAWPYLVTAQFFGIYFTIELLIRFLAFKVKTDCLRDGWFKFDVFLVSTMILDMWILMPILFLMAGDGVKIPTQPLRMLRLFKLTRVARLMMAFPELVIMIKGLSRALRAIASSLLLVGLMAYFWSILLHGLLKEDKKYNAYLKEQYDFSFSKIGDCMWTLIMTGTLMLDNSALLMTDLMYNREFSKFLAGVAVLAYCFLSALLILQMLIGVLCEVVKQVDTERKEAESVGLVKQELLQNLRSMDGGDGLISREELGDVMNYPTSKAVLKKLNINRPFLLQMAELMYPEDEDGQLPIRVVLDVILMCRGANNCTVEILASAMCFLSNEISQLQDQILRAKVSVDGPGITGTSSKHVDGHFELNI